MWSAPGPTAGEIEPARRFVHADRCEVDRRRGRKVCVCENIRLGYHRLLHSNVPAKESGGREGRISPVPSYKDILLQMIDARLS